MILSFEIIMPKVDIWNSNLSKTLESYFSFREVSKVDKEIVLQGSESKIFQYNFGDGWVSEIKVKCISTRAKHRIQKRNFGFIQYDWIVDSILKSAKDRIISKQLKLEDI